MGKRFGGGLVLSCLWTFEHMAGQNYILLGTYLFFPLLYLIIIIIQKLSLTLYSLTTIIVWQLALSIFSKLSVAVGVGGWLCLSHCQTENAALTSPLKIMESTQFLFESKWHFCFRPIHYIWFWSTN